MPVMDGFEASKRIIDLCEKNTVHKPYIVALTGYDDAMVAQKCKNVGMSEFI
jgi:CheY-like chemotaxis protein